MSIDAINRPELMAWLVTSRHRGTVLGSTGHMGPYGPQHTRRGGDWFTLCGLVAFDWPLFWDMRFDADSAMACDSCARGIRSRLEQVQHADLAAEDLTTQALSRGEFRTAAPRPNPSQLSSEGPRRGH